MTSWLNAQECEASEEVPHVCSLEGQSSPSEDLLLLPSLIREL